MKNEARYLLSGLGSRIGGGVLIAPNQIWSGTDGMVKFPSGYSNAAGTMVDCSCESSDFRLKIDDSGLMQSLATLVERFGQETGIAVYFQNDCQALALTPTQEIQLFYIIQEALTNIRKHSGAQNVRVMLNNEDDLYTVLIEDDGLGMAGPAAPLAGEHAGLAIMQERTAKLPGQIVIESEPGEGTRIVLIFNAPPAAAPAVAVRG